MTGDRKIPPSPSGSLPDEEDAGGFALDPRAIAVSFWGFRYWLAGGIVLAVCVALAVAHFLAERTYTAETVMLYQPPPVETPEAATIPSLNTLLSMVKLSSNLEVVRERLELPVDLRHLGAATSVDLQQRTTLVNIKARWDNPRVAADIANTLRDAFLENQARLRREDAEGRIRDLENRLDPVNAVLRQAESALRVFTSENRVVNLSQEARATLDELASVNLLVEQARIEKASLTIQVESADRLIAELEGRLAAEQQAAAALSDAMSETNIRIQRLRESISDDREGRANEAMLEQARLSLKRAEQLHEDGIIPLQQLEEERARFSVIETRTVDTPQIEAWRAEIEELDKRVIPSADASGGLSGNLLKDVMFLRFQIRLQQTSAEEKLASLEAAQAKVEERLSRMPDLHRTHAELTRDVESAEVEKRDLEIRLSEARRLLEASSLPFILVAEATPPIRSSSSNKRKLFAASFVVFSGMFFSFFAALAILDPRIRTRRELELALKPIPVLAEIPASMEWDAEPASGNHIRMLARRIQTDAIRKPVVLMVASTGHDEGADAITHSLAAAFSAWEQKVLVIDARLPTKCEQTSSNTSSTSILTQLRRFQGRGVRKSSLAKRDESGPGLAEYLTGNGIKVGELIRHQDNSHFDLLTSGAKVVSTDLLVTAKMRDLVSEMKENYEVVLLESSPVLGNVDAEHLSLLCDAALFVVEAHHPFASAIKEAIEILSLHQVCILGGVLTKVRPEFSSVS